MDDRSRRSPWLTTWLVVACLQTPGCGFLACDNNAGPPPVSRCETGDVDVSVDSLSVTAEHVTGPQGGDMIMFSPTWLGSDPPACAELTWAVDDLAGASLTGGTSRLETSPVAGGAQSLDRDWTFWDSLWPCDVELTVTSYGLTASAIASKDYCATDGGRRDASDAPDAGPGDAGAPDGS